MDVHGNFKFLTYEISLTTAVSVFLILLFIVKLLILLRSPQLVFQLFYLMRTRVPILELSNLQFQI